jgi:hypothetical protein
MNRDDLEAVYQLMSEEETSLDAIRVGRSLGFDVSLYGFKHVIAEVVEKYPDSPLARRKAIAGGTDAL